MKDLQRQAHFRTGRRYDLEKMNSFWSLWKWFAVAIYCTGYLFSKFRHTTCGTFLCGNENPKSSDSRHAWLWQLQTKLYCWTCDRRYITLPFQCILDTKVTTRNEPWIRLSLNGFMIVQSSWKNILGQRIVLRRRMIWVKKQGNWGCSVTKEFGQGVRQQL